MPAPEPAPAEPKAAAGTNGGGIAEAERLADQLGTVLRALEQDVQQREQELADLRDQVSSLQAGGEAAARVRQALSAASDEGPSSQTLQEMTAKLDALVQSPRDIDVLRDVSQHAAAMSAALNDYAKLRSLLNSIRTAIGRG
jgi:chromosome segregation ATPase